MAHPLLDTITQLTKEIEKARRDLEGMENALHVLQEMAVSQGLHKQTSSAPLSDTIQIDQLELPEHVKQPTLKDQIREIIPRFGEQEFTVVHIEAVLNQMGINISGKYPRSRIATVLGKIEDEQFIARTFSGKGNVPHKYKLAKPDGNREKTQRSIL